MKNLKTTSVFTVIMAVVFSFTACKKDNNSGQSGGSSAYKYNGTTYTIAKAYEKHIDEDIFLELDDKTGVNGLQISFANVNTIPQGVLTYHADRNVGYNPQTNFWASSMVLTGANINISGGTVTVSRSGNKLKIVFNLETANGPITGEYNDTPSVI